METTPTCRRLTFQTAQASGVQTEGKGRASKAEDDADSGASLLNIYASARSRIGLVPEIFRRQTAQHWPSRPGRPEATIKSLENQLSFSSFCFIPFSISHPGASSLSLSFLIFSPSLVSPLFLLFPPRPLSFLLFLMVLQPLNRRFFHTAVSQESATCQVVGYYYENTNFKFSQLSGISQTSLDIHV